MSCQVQFENKNMMEEWKLHGNSIFSIGIIMICPLGEWCKKWMTNSGKTEIFKLQKCEAENMCNTRYILRKIIICRAYVNIFSDYVFFFKIHSNSHLFFCLRNLLPIFQMNDLLG